MLTKRKFIHRLTLCHRPVFSLPLIRSWWFVSTSLVHVSSEISCVLALRSYRGDPKEGSWNAIEALTASQKVVASCSWTQNTLCTSMSLWTSMDYVSLVQNVWSSLKVNGQNWSKLQLRPAKVYKWHCFPCHTPFHFKDHGWLQILMYLEGCTSEIFSDFSRNSITLYFLHFSWATVWGHAVRKASSHHGSSPARCTARGVT